MKKKRSARSGRKRNIKIGHEEEEEKQEEKMKRLDLKQKEKKQ